MGRKARHLTLDEKKAAKCEQQKKYAQSDRGRVRKAVQNKRAYTARKGNIIPSPFHRVIPGIAQDILRLARRPCPLSTAQDPEAPEDLGLWTTPYILEVPEAYEEADTEWGEMDDFFREKPAELQDMAAFERSLHAHQFACLKEAGLARVRQWSDCVDKEAVVTYWNGELSARLRAWEDMNADDRARGNIGQLVWDIGREWAAKIVCTLKVEIDLMVTPEDEYSTSYNEGRLLWQCMNVVSQA
ncbi:uncharacterized protein C8Q71DRAFT_861242 [Rhodofomes roseus]|uniref:BZIP domain-containing protein n=1 Tax=Rhodofomes roseus TaxID=34475 RepID=A0ABQ8K745_9APHY|nr:uncharacterized protein C8Q71DRAFT_861242 [Rhodofomes roseus]KAH9832353.1 hypothetical protein C8Q71DRAFT_861242 [Rhodofomes roseus]